MAPELRVITGAGEVAEDLTALPSREHELLEVIVRQQRQIAALKGEITKLRKVDPDAEVIGELLEYWRSRTRHPRARIPLDGSRAKVTKARLADFEPEQLRRAIDGVAEFPFMGRFGERFCEDGPDRKRKDDLELIFRDERHVEDAMRLAAGDREHAAYRELVWRLCQVEPVRVVLAMFGEQEPHGEVLAAAARWACSHDEGKRS